MAQRAKGPTIPDIIAKAGRHQVMYECRVSATTVQNWERGAVPKVKHFLILAKLGGVPVDPRLEALAPPDEE